jgi:hypothetical protein
MKFRFRFLAVTAAGLFCFASSNIAHAASEGGTPSQAANTIIVPGPLRSFLRMAGVSQEASPAEVLPLFARNAFLYGRVEQRKTEYLVLADRYVQQARELQPLTGADGMIHVTGCDDAGKLIQVLGYKFENGCSPKDASLITADAERAFLTVDSGFPLTQLEQSLQNGTPFSYAYPATKVPILFSETDWETLLPSKERAGVTLLDLLLNDEDVDRLYAGVARLDPQTRYALLQTVGLRRLLAYASLFDFYGSRICIRSGAVAVPGGDAAEQSWAELVGASPRSPGDFVIRLLAKDQGWLVAYFDALSRVSPEQQAHFVANGRLKRLYEERQLAFAVFPRAMGRGGPAEGTRQPHVLAGNLRTGRPNWPSSRTSAGQPRQRSRSPLGGDGGVHESHHGRGPRANLRHPDRDQRRTAR